MTLAAAYHTTSYRVESPDGAFVLRVGCRSRTLDRLLNRHGLCGWAFVTACNPLSVLVPAEQNAARQEELEAQAARRWWPVLAGRGEGPGWPGEPSLLILGIDEADALALARDYRQAALLVGDRGTPARLAWTGLRG